MNTVKSGLIGISMVALAATILSSCSNPLDKKYNKHNAEDDFRRIVELKKLDSAEARMMAKYMVDHGLIGSHVLELHATYADILAEAKREKEKHEKENRKDRKETDYAKIHEIEKLKNLNKALKVILIQEDTIGNPAEIKTRKPVVKKPENKNILTYKIAFQNTGEDTIKAFKGDIAFYDLFQSEVKKINFNSFKSVNPGDSIVQSFTVNLEEVNTGNNISVGLTRKNLKIEWHPERLIYLSGQIIE